MSGYATYDAERRRIGKLYTSGKLTVIEWARRLKAIERAEQRALQKRQRAERMLTSRKRLRRDLEASKELWS